MRTVTTAISGKRKTWTAKMLRAAAAADVERYIGDWYRLATDPTRSGYPSYCNGIKTKRDLADEITRCIDCDGRGALVYAAGGAVTGLVCFFYIERDSYLQTVVAVAERGAADMLDEFERYARRRFGGYTLCMGFHAENAEAAAWLGANGYEQTQRLIDTLLPADASRGATAKNVTRIDESSFADFERLHAACEGDMYWTAARIRERLHAWRIYVAYAGGEPRGAVYVTGDEVFGVDVDGAYDGALVTELLRAAAADATGSVIFFCEPSELAAAEAAGFVKTGEYILFEKRL